MEKLLNGKTVLVTGGGRGLGEAICRTLASSGASVVVADIRNELAQTVAGSIRDGGGKAIAQKMDVTRQEDAHAGIERAISELGRLDVLINNAGTDMTVPIDRLSVADWDRILSTNLRAPFVLSKHALAHMSRKGGGQIVNIVSTAAKRAWPNASAYHASKWGLLGFSHALHVEARPHRVKVTAVVCGGMRTPFLLDRFPDIDLETLQDPNDVAKTVQFILTAPEGTVIPEIMAIPMRESSWP